MSRWHQPTWEAAAGKWRGVLMELGVPGEALTGRHCPCPMCGGTDRFRWDNKGGSGSYLCSQCGAGTGMQFAERFTGLPFKEVAARIDSILGNIKPDADAPRRTMTDEQCLAALRETAAQTVRVEPGDLVDTYLTARGLGDDAYPKALRFARALRDGEGGVRPCMVATVQAPDGSNATLHRTFLRPDGRAKAEMEVPRKLMPGGLPDGSAIRLGGFEGGALGVAEGVETALAASRLYEMPCWALIAAGNMVKFEPPEGCDELVVFADNDENFTGHAVAYRLANRVKVRRKIDVAVRLPERPGKDWNDVLLSIQGDMR